MVMFTHLSNSDAQFLCVELTSGSVPHNLRFKASLFAAVVFLTLVATVVRSVSAPKDCWPHIQTYSFSTLVLVSGYERVSKPLPILAHASSSFLC